MPIKSSLYLSYKIATACITLLFSISALAAQENIPVDIEWRVNNPFPFINDPQMVEKLQQGLKKINEQNSFDLYAKAVAESYNQTMWDTEKQKYKPELIHFKTLKVDVKLKNADSGSTCIWQAINNSTLVDCSQWTPVVVNLGQAGNLTVESTTREGLRQTTQITIEPKKEVILGLGDSFSSGEGNPDRASTWDEKRINQNEASNYKRHWPISYQPNEAELADWNDVSCHRSLYSWQFMYALNKAGYDPHTVTSFVSFACSGAEIYDGLITTQAGINNTKKAPDSQLNEAVTLLCREPTSTIYAGEKYRAITDEVVPINFKTCSDHALVKPDQVLLTIGGNDIGFSGLIAWSSFPANGYNFINSATAMKIINSELMKETKLVCPQKDSLGDWRCRQLFAAADELKEGNFAINQKFAFESLINHLHINANNIHYLTYPVPINNEEGKLCDTKRAKAASAAMKNELFNKFSENMKGYEIIDRYTPFLKNKYSNFTIGPLPKKVKLVNEMVVEPLQAQIKQMEMQGINVVDVASTSKKHGFCAYTHEWELDLPYLLRDKMGKSYWKPLAYRPSTYNPWQNMARWFRTPNDAQLTMYEDKIYNNKSKSKAWLYGLFHPNHLGHYAMFQQLEQDTHETLP